MVSSSQKLSVCHDDATNERRRQVHLVAHDWGGIVAWFTAGRADGAAALASLTIIDSPHPNVMVANGTHSRVWDAVLGLAPTHLVEARVTRGDSKRGSFLTRRDVTVVTGGVSSADLSPRAAPSSLFFGASSRGAGGRGTPRARARVSARRGGGGGGARRWSAV